MKWEILKAEIKSFTVQYCTNKNQTIFSEEKRLFFEIERISNLLLENPQSNHLQQELATLKQKYEIFELNKAKGAQVRSRVKYIDEGEKNTKYFLGIEKITSSNNTIHELKQHNNNIVDPLKILSEINSFYTSLYKKDEQVDTSDDSVDNFLKNINCPKLSTYERDDCNKNISVKELGVALSSMNNNDSAPGCDGLTTPFYKFFWSKIQLLVFESINCALNKGELSMSQKRGIITVHHKGGDRNNLGNERPISLLNTDYKIFSKVIALRMQTVIDTIIHPLQKGFLKGRNISEIIRLIDDSLSFARQNNTPGLLVSVDFQKAFDSISKDMIINSLRFFNFGSKFIKMVSVLINNNESCVRNGGWHSSWFSCNRGVRQGCSSSPYLFIIVAELLSIRLRNSTDIQGLTINNSDFKLSKTMQYADDLSLFLKDEIEVESTFCIIEQFGKISGLRLNRHKSIILPFCGYIRSENALNNVKWLKSNDCIKILGIYFSSEKEASKIDLNWNSKIENMKKTTSRWNKRDISLYGRIILCKTFLLSQINYVIQSLILPDQVLNEIDSIMFQFIWQKPFSHKKPIEKIKRKILCLDIEQGGLKMISIKDQQQVYNIKWISKAAIQVSNPTAWLANVFLSKLGGIPYILKSSLSNPMATFDPLIDNWFWKKAACSWSLFHFNILSEKRMLKNNFLVQPIFLNSNINYKNNPLRFPKWMKKGVLFICDIIDKNCLKIEIFYRKR